MGGIGGRGLKGGGGYSVKGKMLNIQVNNSLLASVGEFQSVSLMYLYKQ